MINTKFAITRWSRDQKTRDTISKRERKENIYKSSLHLSLKMKTLPLTKMSYTNSPPKYMTTLIPKTTPPFFHE